MKGLDILYEDNHLLIINKVPGVLVQGDKTGDEPLVEAAKNYLKIQYEKPGSVFLGVVHRLDRPASGIVVFARTSKALTRMNSLFASNNIRKTYWVITKERPTPEQATIVHWLKRNAKQNKSYAYPKEVNDSKKAELSYHILLDLNNYHLLEIDLHTGRHHQIRAQLAALGSPIKGDLKYGSPRSNADGSIHLHARKLEFVHPVSHELLKIVAPPPPDALWDACLTALLP